MLHYDVIIIGSGIAGYMAAIHCLDAGLNTAVISRGQSALHFSSGSIDLLSHSPLDHQPINDPWKAIERLRPLLPQHPYAKLDQTTLHRAMTGFQSVVAREGFPLSHLPDGHNHYRITPLGTLKATWLSQPYVMKFSSDRIKTSSFERIWLVSLAGYRDFQPHIAADNLKRHPAFESIPIDTVAIHLDRDLGRGCNPGNVRSIDLARQLKQPALYRQFVQQLMATATPRDLVILPAILGDGDGLVEMNRLQRDTRLQFHEVPTMPPSLLGIRLENVLMHGFLRRGGRLHKGDHVLGGQFERHGNSLSLMNITTRKMGEIALTAPHYILASGSFFSKGLIAQRQSVIEPIFGLDIDAPGDRHNWYQPTFFSQQPHAFLSFGVKTDEAFRPFIQCRPIANLFCAGSVLSGYDPITHGCGGGVAISTAWAAANHVIQAHLHSVSTAEDPV